MLLKQLVLPNINEFIFLKGVRNMGRVYWEHKYYVKQKCTVSFPWESPETFDQPLFLVALGQKM